MCQGIEATASTSDLLSEERIDGSVSDASLASESLISTDQEGNASVQPWFQSIQPDLIRLIKRSYVNTKRDTDGQFRHEGRMLSQGASFVIPETGHEWVIDRNFTGVHGRIENHSWLQKILNGFLECITWGGFSAEIDFPGFVGLMKPNETCPYYVIAVVLRGSQGEDFQPGSGMLGASWATNYDAVPENVRVEEFGFEGSMHAGYTTKVRSFNFIHDEIAQMVSRGEIENPLHSEDLDFICSLTSSIACIISQVPKDELHKIRFVVTGHSQGGGLAQVTLPYLIQIFGNEFRALPNFIDNISTPRFFGYFLSAPRVAADKYTVTNYTEFVGYDNMINHFAFRDIVTMACLDGYLTLGHLACDAAFDILYRGICSEIACNNRLLLMGFFKRHLDFDRFDIANDDCWVYDDNPNLMICWKEIRRILAREYFNASNITEESFLNLLNQALGEYRVSHGIESDEYFTTDHTLLNDVLDWDKIRAICRGDLAPNEIHLDEERCAILHRVEDNISGETVSFSETGRWNVISLIDTALDLLDATRDTHNSGGCGEVLKRIFCCTCCANPLKVGRSYFFDPKFRELVEECIEPQEYGITPAGNISLFSYLHYGTSANAEGEKSFDPYLPSRNLDHALQNGRKLSGGESAIILEPEIRCDGIDGPNELYDEVDEVEGINRRLLKMRTK
jgi:hypothetical protein